MLTFISNFLANYKNAKILLVLLGPTASGKTALSIEIAKKFNGEIISADSRQIYRHMDIGTDKIPVSKREGISHYMMDIVEPDERFTVSDFKKQSEKIIDDILSRKRLPMIVGGTGLYINALTQNFLIPPENPAIRKKLMEDLKKNGKESLYKRLEKLDPESAARIHPNNSRYVLRALEIIMSTGVPKRDATQPPKYQCLKIGLNWPRETLHGRINLRADEQIKRGLIEETKKLLDMGYKKELPSMSSLGYKEMIKYLDGELSLEEAFDLLKRNTRHYSRRQIAWFKRDKDIVWFPVPDELRKNS